MTSAKKILSFNKLVLLATISGMRSMMAPSLLCLNLKSDDKSVLRESGFDFLGEEKAQKTLGILATAEIIADKLPFAPSRMKSALLTGRALSGSATGALTYELEGRDPGKGAILGGIIALASSALFFGLRKGLSKSKLIPEPLTGLAEDFLAFYLASQYLRLLNQDVENENEML